MVQFPPSYYILDLRCTCESYSLLFTCMITSLCDIIFFFILNLKFKLWSHCHFFCGFNIVTGVLVLPFVECLMFGSLISATDPVTVLSIFQDEGLFFGDEGLIRGRCS